MKDRENSEDNGFQLNNVALIATAHLVHDIYSSFLAPILPLLIAKFGLSYTMAGLLTVAQRAPFLFNPLMGLLVDRIRTRYFLILAPAITAVSMSLLGVAPNYAVLVVLLLSMGIGAMCFHVPGPVMMKAVSGNRVGQGMGYFMLGGEAARSIGPLVILGAVSLWGLEGTWKLIPFGLVASAILFFRFRKMVVQRPAPSRSGRSGIRHTLKGFLPFFGILAGYTLFTSLMRFTLMIFLPTYLTGRGEDLWFAGISLSILEVTGAVGTFYGGGLSDRLGRRKLLLIVSLVSPVLGLMFLLTHGWVSIAVLLVLGFSLFAGTPVVLALVQEVRSDRPAFINSIYMTMSFLSSAFTAVAIGWGGDHFGLDNTFRIAFSLSFLAVPFVWFLADRHLGVRP
ncbi:MAG TPA: MFS transporter [Proteobacteria bacterium]|nr:fosmidomycin resistance protein [bacterium BMS3Abin14]HDL52527.1 MFS transporter [Pseudomonadota bacterium]